MPAKLIACMLVRNEGAHERYLRPVLANLEMQCDRIVVLDDCSTDDTVEICKGFGAEVVIRDQHVPRAWGAEASARAELWALAAKHCGPNDFALFCDADMTLHGDPKPLVQSRDLNTWLMPLFDLWSPTQYRSDVFWQGHTFARPWMFAPHRVPNGWQPEWHREGLHVGHCPSNWIAMAGIAPPDIYYLHWAYARQVDRENKLKQYMQTAHLLSPHEKAHAMSIGEEP